MIQHEMSVSLGRNKNICFIRKPIYEYYEHKGQFENQDNHDQIDYVEDES